MFEDLTRSIRTRGFYRVGIRPHRFEKRRVSTLSELESIVRRSAVSLRGWDFPHISRNERVYRGEDFVQQGTDWDYYREVWRFHQSGLFLFIAGYRWDWLDHQDSGMPRAKWKDGRLLPVLYVTKWVTEAFEFAARLAVTEAGDERMAVSIQLSDLGNRTLYIEDPGRSGFVDERVADVEEWNAEYAIDRSKVLDDPRLSARVALLELFDRFGWNPDHEVLKGIQSELRA